MNPQIAGNPPVATPFFFYGLAAVMIIGGILVITRKNAVHSALALITNDVLVRRRSSGIPLQ